MRDRTDVAAYLAIMVSCVAGLFHLSPWAIVLSASGLMLISIMRKHEYAVARLGGGTMAHATAMASSVLNATVIAGAAFASGLIIGWLWGIS